MTSSLDTLLARGEFTGRKVAAMATTIKSDADVRWRKDDVCRCWLGRYVVVASSARAGKRVTGDGRVVSHKQNNERR